MPSKSDLIELARMCVKQARLTKGATVIAALRRMAKEYRRRAAQLDRAPSRFASAALAEPPAPAHAAAFPRPFDL
jgi:hypothetical protein